MVLTVLASSNSVADVTVASGSQSPPLQTVAGGIRVLPAGEGVVSGSDANDVPKEIGTTLPPVSEDPPASSGELVVWGGGPAGTPPVVPINRNTTKTSRRPAPQSQHPRAEIQLGRRGRGWSPDDGRSAMKDWHQVT